MLLKEQLLLSNYKQKRYSSELILLASTIYYSSPSTYNTIRDNGFLVLPHTRWIRKLSSSSFDSSDPNCHYSYLKQRLCGLKEEEKLVNVLLDEIHIKPNLQYKGGKLHGTADNRYDLAKCIQVFMISSLCSSYKDVVALYPVKGLSASDLYGYTSHVLQNLKKTWFYCIIINFG